ncbi:hypothetical protein ACRQ5D_10695 [Mucilaginibacter sp. P25]|uniref:hypothetical protein n=1 Tax=Mucilaginibacter sp. P25 TaxID=3423945 RepID=UPI003D7BA011
MKKHFLVKAYKMAAGDRFGMGNTTANGFYTFYCCTLADLFKTIRIITPQGYRVPKAATLSKRLRNGAVIEGRNLLRNKTMEVKEIKEPVAVTQVVTWTNRNNLTHDLKLTEAEF